MIHIGTMNWPSTRGKGEFLCPVCDAVTPYVHKVSRPFLTLYFIPVVPIGKLQEFLQCKTCRQTFSTSVLSESGAVEMLQRNRGVQSKFSFDVELLRVMALIMADDGNVSQSEIDTARRVYRGMTGKELTETELLEVYRQITILPLTTTSYLATISTNLSYDQKLLVIQAMFTVAGAEGEIAPNRMQSLLEARSLLDVGEKDFQQTIVDAPQWVN